MIRLVVVVNAKASMSRRQKTVLPHEPGPPTPLPSMANLSLVVRGDDISAPKRKAPAQYTDPNEEEGPLSEEEARSIAEEAIGMLASLNDLMSGNTLVEVERQTRLLLDAQPMLFRIDPARIAERTRAFEKVVDKVRPPNPAACPKKSSCVRLLQSLKAAYFAVAHQPFSQPLPTGGEFDQIKDEMERVREKLKQAVNALGRSVFSASSGAGPSSDAGPSSEGASTEDGNLERFENNVARMLLFGDVQIVPFAERASLLDDWDRDMSVEVVNRAAMDVLKMHMEMMFYITSASLTVNKVLVPKQILDVMNEGPLQPKANIAPRMIRHILDDMQSLEIDANNSMLAKEYWRMLRMLFDTTVDFEDGVFVVNEEAETMRSTQPTQDDINEFNRVKEAYRSKEPSTLTPKDAYDVKVAYIKLFMRIAMYQNSQWSWFANSSLNLFSFDALAFRTSIAQTASGRVVSRAQREFVRDSIDEMRQENPNSLPPVVQRAIDQQEDPAVGADESEKATAAEAMEEDSVVEGDDAAEDELPDAADSGTTLPAEATAGELISSVVLNSVAETAPQPDTGRVLRSEEATTEMGDDQALTSDASLMPLQSDAAAASEARYAAVSKENKSLKEQLEKALKDMQNYASMLESASQEAGEAEKQIGDLQNKIDEAARKAEQTEQETAAIKKRASLATQAYNKAVKLKQKSDELLKEKEALSAELKEAQDKQADAESALDAANEELDSKKDELELRLAQSEAAASKEQELEVQLQGLRDQLKRTEQAAQRRSSSSSSENSGPGKAIVDRMIQRMAALEAELKRIKKTRTTASSGSSSKGGPSLSASQLKQIVDAVKSMQDQGQAMKDMSAELRKAELEKQLGELGSVSRMVKRYHRNSTDVLGWIYGWYKNGKTLTMLLHFLMRSSSRAFNGSAIIDALRMGLFGVGSYILVEIAEYLLSGETSPAMDKWLSENVDIRTFVLLYQAVVQYTYLTKYRGSVLPLNLVNLLDSWTGIPTAIQGFSDLLSLGSTALDYLRAGGFLDTITLGGASRMRNVAVALLIVGGAYKAGPTLIKLAGKLFRSWPVAPVFGRVIVRLSVYVAEGLQVFYGIFMWRQIIHYVSTPTHLLGSPFVQAVVKAFGLAKEAAAQLVSWIQANPKTTVSVIALAFALRYAARKYKLQDKTKKFVQRQLAKRSRWLQERRDEEAGVRRLEGLSYQEAMAIIVIRSQRLLEQGVADMDSGISPPRPNRPELMPPSEGDDAAEDPLPEAEDDTADTGVMEDIDAFDKITGTRIDDKMCGAFVLLAEPHNNPGVSVAACAALMLSTDLHGLGR